MTNEEIKKLKDAGIDDATIQGIIAEDAAKQGVNVQAGAPVTPVAPESLPEVDVNQPSDTLKNAQAMGVPTVNEGSLMADAAALGVAAAPYVLPAAGIGAGLYGAAKVGGWGNNLLTAAQQAGEAYKTGVAQNAATQEFRALERMARIPGPEGELAKQRLQELIRAQSGIQQGAGQVTQAGKQAFSQMGQQLSRPPVAGPINPVNVGYSGPSMQANAVSELEDLFKKVPEGKVPTSTRVPGPISPTSMPSASPIAQTATKAAPGLIDRTTQMVRQIAASKILPAAGSMARGSVGPGMALYSGELNTGEEEELRRRRMMQPTITR